MVMLRQIKYELCPPGERKGGKQAEVSAEDPDAMFKVFLSHHDDKGRNLERL